MKIKQTSIPDVTETNLDQEKLFLANNIIKNVYPLFDEIIDSKIKGTDSLEEELKKFRKVVFEKKSELEKLMKEHERKQKISKLLHRLDKLIRSGLIYDGTLKNETIVLLRVIHNLDSKRLDMQLDYTMQILNKRFASS